MKRLMRRMWTIGTWSALAGGLLVVGSVLVGVPLTPTIVAAQGLLPAVGVALAAVTAAAIVRHDGWGVAAGSLLTLAVAALVVPTTTPDEVPRWARSADRFTVHSANLWYGNQRVDEAFATADAGDTDLVVFSEFMPAFEPALRRSGLLDRYEHRVAGHDTLILSRHPARAVEGPGPTRAVVDVDGREVLIVAVHPLAPHTMRHVGRWREGVAQVGEVSAAHDDVIAVGDFNGTVWNPPVRALLADGFTDAHAATGRGLARTWGPRLGGDRRSPPVIGIDRALSRGAIAPLWIGERVVPGGDHRAIDVTYAVKAAER